MYRNNAIAVSNLDKIKKDEVLIYTKIDRLEKRIRQLEQQVRTLKQAKK
ncbi:hypothetical protein [Helicobacter pylori]|nr:hypothetical protein [Helicobacter pylori]